MGANGWLRGPDGRRWPCALGRAGVTAAKREGDGATPLGTWPLRRVFHRADRVPASPDVGRSGLSVAPLTPTMAWCDDPGHADYNRLVTLPHPAGHETLWRDDPLYDVVVVLGHNDAPPVPGQGSAIFLHCARADSAGRHGLHPTAGCIALPRADLLAILAALPPAPVLLRVRVESA
ncbi:L,D-transpeptidase family protein [Roseospira marina]|uniref:L,D-transpeptidase family protein n=1 Tax=Roseospira marina TaxID=140057 RepID=A0A5M6IE56_9PROT|nr:L,D-transpeptidase family protein [Roseospira marina]KAA5606571.1 L,D-transpeptidase family protein [Roseospira marina]